jgi:hypothetical protein
MQFQLVLVGSVIFEQWSGSLWWGGRPRPRSDPLVGPGEAISKLEIREPESDEGVRRGPGGPPHFSGESVWSTTRGCIQNI